MNLFDNNIEHSIYTVSCQKYSRKMADVLKRHISTAF